MSGDVGHVGNPGARQLGMPGMGTHGGAVISDCGRYRYRLWRRWGRGAHALFCMLNPSTADAQVDDPTIRKCIGFARRWGCDAIEVVNLFAWRATDPSALAGVEDPVGPDNEPHIIEAARAAELVVVAWGGRPSGVDPSAFKERGARTARLLGGAPLCLGRTFRGEPRHPLMLAYETKLAPWCRG